MGYNGKIDEKVKAQQLRQKGYSYNEILEQVHVSKDTLSRWCKNIELTIAQKQRLIKLKVNGQKKGSIIAAENKKSERIKITEQIYQKAKNDINRLSERDFFITGVSLYAGEGDKTIGRAGFCNSDPKLIKFMMKWFLNYTKLPMSKFHGAIWLHEDLNESEAKKYWSDLTRIPISQFYKTYIAVNKSKSQIQRKNIHKYGIFAIRFCDNNNQRKILGWISAVFDDKISSVH
jgi:hypothetical protein